MSEAFVEMTAGCFFFILAVTDAIIGDITVLFFPLFVSGVIGVTKIVVIFYFSCT